MSELFSSEIRTTPPTLDALSVQELRTEARKHNQAVWIASAKKAELIDFLRTGSEPTPTPTPATGDPAALIAQACALMAGSNKASTDPEEVKAICASMIAEAMNTRPAPVQVIANGTPGPIIDEQVHPAFPQICRLVAAGLPVMLVGPAGTGKTTLAGQVAKALGKSFTFNSCSAGMSESHVLGRTLPDENGNWTYQPALFVETYGNGGLHLFDEFDAADANLLVVLNAAIANGHLSLPMANRIIERHPDAAIMAACNTYGTGPDRQYVGRNQLDAATLDRFALSTVEVGYNEDLEAQLLGLPTTGSATRNPYQGKPPATPEQIQAFVLQTRRAIEANGLRRIMSTRTLANAVKLSRAGFSIDEIRDLYFASWTADEKRRAA